MKTASVWVHQQIQIQWRHPVKPHSAVSFSFFPTYTWIKPWQRKYVLFSEQSRETGLRSFQIYSCSHHGFIAWTCGIFRTVRALGLPVIRGHSKVPDSASTRQSCSVKHDFAKCARTCLWRCLTAPITGSLERGGLWSYRQGHSLNPFHRGNWIQYLAALVPADGSFWAETSYGPMPSDGMTWHWERHFTAQQQHYFN